MTPSIPSEARAWGPAAMIPRRARDGGWARAARAAFVVGVVVWLTYRLAGIGWTAVWEARPRTPWFYVIWMAAYVQLPVVETLLYRALWNLEPAGGFLPLLRKRTLNQDVLSGLGEAYFFAWARTRLPLPDRRIAGTIKDNLIAASVAAWSSLGLLVLVASPVLMARALAAGGPILPAVGALAIGVGGALLVRFRRTVFTLPPRTVLVLVGVHGVRFVLLVYALQVLQWWVVVPGAPLHLWVAMLVVVTAVNRLPFIPVRDLTGVGAVLGVVAPPTSLEASVAAMLLVRSVLDRVCNLGVFVVGAAADRRRGRPV